MSKRNMKKTKEVVNRTKLAVVNCETLEVQGYVGRTEAQKAKIDIDGDTQPGQLVEEINGFIDSLDEALAQKVAAEAKLKESAKRVVSSTAEFDKWFTLLVEKRKDAKSSLLK